MAPAPVGSGEIVGPVGQGLIVGLRVGDTGEGMKAVGFGVEEGCGLIVGTTVVEIVGPEGVGVTVGVSVLEIGEGMKAVGSGVDDGCGLTIVDGSVVTGVKVGLQGGETGKVLNDGLELDEGRTVIVGTERGVGIAAGSEKVGKAVGFRVVATGHIVLAVGTPAAGDGLTLLVIGKEEGGVNGDKVDDNDGDFDGTVVRKVDGAVGNGCRCSADGEVCGTSGNEVGENVGCNVGTMMSR